MTSPGSPQTPPRPGQSWGFTILFLICYGLLIVHAWDSDPTQGWRATLSGLLAAAGCAAIIRDVKYPFALRSLLCLTITYVWSCSCFLSLWVPRPAARGVFADYYYLNDGVVKKASGPEEGRLAFSARRRGSFLLTGDRLDGDVGGLAELLVGLVLGDLAQLR